MSQGPIRCMSKRLSALTDGLPGFEITAPTGH